MSSSKGIAWCGVILVASTGIATVAVSAEAKEPVVVQGPSRDTVTRRISYGDLNLASVTGEETLNQRVRAAVKGACFKVNGPSHEFHIQGACRSQAMSGAQPQIAQAVLRAQQIAATGQSLIAVSAITLIFPK